MSVNIAVLGLIFVIISSLKDLLKNEKRPKKACPREKSSPSKAA